MTPQQLIEDIQNNIEWLDADGESIECISIENLEAALSKFLSMKIQISEEW